MNLSVLNHVAHWHHRRLIGSALCHYSFVCTVATTALYVLFLLFIAYWNMLFQLSPRACQSRRSSTHMYRNSHIEPCQPRCHSTCSGGADILPPVTRYQLPVRDHSSHRHTCPFWQHKSPSQMLNRSWHIVQIWAETIPPSTAPDLSIFAIDQLIGRPRGGGGHGTWKGAPERGEASSTWLKRFSIIESESEKFRLCICNTTVILSLSLWPLFNNHQ